MSHLSVLSNRSISWPWITIRKIVTSLPDPIPRHLLVGDKAFWTVCGWALSSQGRPPQRPWQLTQPRGSSDRPKVSQWAKPVPLFGQGRLNMPEIVKQVLQKSYLPFSFGTIHNSLISDEWHSQSAKLIRLLPSFEIRLVKTIPMTPHTPDFQIRFPYIREKTGKI